MRNFSKLKDGPMLNEKFCRKEYLMKMNLTDARMNFRLRSKTTNVKLNQKSSKSHAAKLWKCGECGYLDSQSHIMWCTYFAPLREGLDVKNDLDVVHYFQQVSNTAMKTNEYGRTTLAEVIQLHWHVDFLTDIVSGEQTVTGWRGFKIFELSSVLCSI